MNIYYFDILSEYYESDTKKSIFEYINSFIFDNVDYFYNLNYKIDNFKINNCINSSNQVENGFVIVEEIENNKCEIKFTNARYIVSITECRTYCKSSEEFLRAIEFKEGEFRKKEQERKLQNMKNYSINLRSYYREVICPSTNYEDSNSDYIKFVKSFIEDNEEFFLERGFNLDYFTVEQALKYPVLMTNRLREPRSLGFTLETSAKSFDRKLLTYLSVFMNRIDNYYPRLDGKVENNEIKESELDLETITSTLNNTCNLLLIRRRRNLK